MITIYLWALFGHSFKILWNWALNHRTYEYSRYLELRSLKWPSNRSLCRNIQNCLPQGLLIVMLLWSVTILGTSRWIATCCESTWDQVDKLTLHSECQPPPGLVSQLTSGATRIIYRHLVGNQAVYSELLSVQLTMTHVPNVGIGYFLKTANLQRHWLVVNPIIFGDGFFMVMTWGWFMASGLPNYLVFTSFYNAQTWCPHASGPSLYRSNQSDCEELQILKESLCGKRVCICELHLTQNLGLNQNSRLLTCRAGKRLQTRIAIQARFCPC